MVPSQLRYLHNSASFRRTPLIKQSNTCVRSWYNWRASCVAVSQPKKRKRKSTWKISKIRFENRVRVLHMHIPRYLRTWSVPSPRSIAEVPLDSVGRFWISLLPPTMRVCSCCNCAFRIPYLVIPCQEFVKLKTPVWVVCAQQNGHGIVRRVAATDPSCSAALCTCIRVSCPRILARSLNPPLGVRTA